MDIPLLSIFDIVTIGSTKEKGVKVEKVSSLHHENITILARQSKTRATVAFLSPLNAPAPTGNSVPSIYVGTRYSSALYPCELTINMGEIPLEVEAEIIDVLSEPMNDEQLRHFCSYVERKHGIYMKAQKSQPNGGEGVFAHLWTQQWALDHNFTGKKEDISNPEWISWVHGESYEILNAQYVRWNRKWILSTLKNPRFLYGTQWKAPVSE